MDPLALFIILLSVGLVVFLVPLGLALRRGHTSASDTHVDENERWLIIGVCCASLVLVLSCARANLFDRLSVDRLSAAACAFGLVSLTAAALLLAVGALGKLGKLDSRIGKAAFSGFFSAWWTAGAITLTFYGPFTVTSNGYFACWAALIFSVAMLVATLGRIAAEQTDAAKAALREKRSLAGLLVASAVMIGACISRAYMLAVGIAEVAYPLVCAIATVVCVSVMLLAATKLPDLGKALLALTMLGMWIATLYVATFGLGPFAVTGNGFFAAWLGVIFAALLLISDGHPLLPLLAKLGKALSAGSSKLTGTASKAKDGHEASAAEVKVDITSSKA